MMSGQRAARCGISGGGSGGDGAGDATRPWGRLAGATELVEVEADGLAHAGYGLVVRVAVGDDSRQVGRVGAPAVLALLIDHDVLGHRSSSGPVARRMLPSVPTATSR